jgi:hypothetical protein
MWCMRWKTTLGVGGNCRLFVITGEVTFTPYISASQNMKFSSVNNTYEYGKALVFKHSASINVQYMTSDSVTALAL